MLDHFNEQVAKVRALKKESVLSVCLSIQTPNQSQGTLVRGTAGSPIKLINPPSLPCSQEQTSLKDEANYEQWLFQAREALYSHMEEAV